MVSRTSLFLMTLTVLRRPGEVSYRLSLSETEVWFGKEDHSHHVSSGTLAVSMASTANVDLQCLAGCAPGVSLLPHPSFPSCCCSPWKEVTKSARTYEWGLMLPFLDGSVIVEFFCMGYLSIFPYSFIQLFIHINMGSWVFTLCFEL